MNKNINLCEILKGHEGETFYSPVFGIAILKEMTNNYLCLKSVDKVINLYKDGRYDIHGECMLFPSKDQRDWNKWLKEQKRKVPKTWGDLERLDEIIECGAEIVRTFNNRWWDSTKGKTPIEKSALAFLKINQLIEVGYGGNVTNEEWHTMKDIYQIDYEVHSNTIRISNSVCMRFFTPIAFHTKKQAEEFLSYPENVQLLKDYFMI